MKLLRNSLLLTSIVLATLSSGARAADTGIYVQALGGGASADDWDRITGNAVGIVGTDATAASSLAFGFGGALGYRFSPNLALEVNYLDGGTSSVEFATVATLVEIEKRHAGINLIGIYPLSDQFELYGRFGAAHWNMDTDVTVAGVRQSQHQSGNDITYGAGLSYKLFSHLDLLADYQRIKMNVRGGHLSVNYYLAGLRVTF